LRADVRQALRYYVKRRPAAIARSAQDDQLAADLWDISGELADGVLQR
jgi:hypothetical protein